MKIINGFAFYDYCQSCKIVTKYRIESDNSSVLGVCGSCEQQQALADLNEISYEKPNLWVTRFKIGNMNNVVTGKLIHALRSSDTK